MGSDDLGARWRCSRASPEGIEPGRRGRRSRRQPPPGAFSMPGVSAIPGVDAARRRATPRARGGVAVAPLEREGRAGSKRFTPKVKNNRSPCTYCSLFRREPVNHRESASSDSLVPHSSHRPRAFATMSAARADGRTPGMMRQLKLERAFPRADGSARWEQGEALANPRPRTTPLGTSLARGLTADPSPSSLVASRPLGGARGGVRPTRRAVAQGRPRTHGHRGGAGQPRDSRVRPLDAVSISPPPPRRRASRVRHQPPTTPARPSSLAGRTGAFEDGFRTSRRLTIPASPDPPTRPSLGGARAGARRAPGAAAVVLVQKHPRLVARRVAACLRGRRRRGVRDERGVCGDHGCGGAVPRRPAPRRRARWRGGETPPSWRTPPPRNCVCETKPSRRFVSAEAVPGGRIADAAARARAHEPAPFRAPEAEPEVLHTTSRGVYASEEAYCEATALTRTRRRTCFFFRDRREPRARRGAQRARRARRHRGAQTTRRRARAMRARTRGARLPAGSGDGKAAGRGKKTRDAMVE